MHETKRSRELFAEAQRLLPGGVDSPVRAFSAVGGRPLFIERGSGAHLYDVDGNRYIDYVLSWGPLIAGHAHPEVVEAVMSALRVARAFSGREKVVKFQGNYHGHADMLLVQAGSGVATLGLPDSPGVPRGATAEAFHSAARAK